MVCRGCGARRSEGEQCPFCGHDSAFERLHSSERTIGWFWKSVYFLVAGVGILFLLTILQILRNPTGS